MKKFYDIAIIGAGPAGAIFAKEVATHQPNLRILLVNGQNKDRPKPCGGLLSPGAQLALAELELTLPETVLVGPQPFAVKVIDLEAKISNEYQRYYLNMDRTKFDQWLLSLVPNTVDIIEGRCIDLYKQDGFLITLKLDDSIATCMASMIVGADGASSIVRRKFSTNQPKKYVSIQQWFVNKDLSLPAYACIFDKATSDSCSWLIRKKDYIIFGGAFNKFESRSSFEQQKQRLEKYFGFSLGEPIKTEACQVCSPRHKKDIITGEQGAYLIGEAAGFISTSSFEGISFAINSARALAKAINIDNLKITSKNYYKNTRKLRYECNIRIIKHRLLFSPFIRKLIIKSRIRSIKNKRR